MLPQREQLLRKTSRPLDLAVGYVCAIISILFTALLVWLVYIIGWRNPREHDTHDFLKPVTLVIFSVLFIIAFGFSVIAFRLIAGKGKRLMSPTVLRLWGIFFVLGGVVVLAEALANKDWTHMAGAWETLAGTVSMAIACFALARKQTRTTRSAAAPPDGTRTSAGQK